MPHQCGLPPSPALFTNKWKMSKEGPAESYLALPTTLTMITPYLPSISPHWLPDTKRPLSRWVEACCATHGYGISSPLTHPSQSMPDDTQTWSCHSRPQELTVIIRLLSSPWSKP
ncbi:hypothetical protein E2C01_066275 [Portunus trituberculatus]|uniref:Uncharacterized protein n=1 Tax=Portunus trituberculatus TaxID=210409 RepID=A0A5B7HPB6_PORTR|nr:hypothetical protein [Portunus trituberculatus]